MALGHYDADSGIWIYGEDDTVTDSSGNPSLSALLNKNANSLVGAYGTMKGFGATNDAVVAALVNNSSSASRAAVVAAVSPSPAQAINVKAAPYNAKGDGSTNDTAAIQAALNAGMTQARAVYLPAGTYMVSSVGVDYSGASWAAQPSSGAPYGYPAPVVFGDGPRLTTLKQITGSTGNVFNVKGKTGTASGPGNNNKITGFRLADLQIIGTTGGGNGVQMQSAVNSGLQDVWINNCGGSGWYLVRDTFVSGVNDEYMYSLSGLRLKLNSNGRDGLEMSGVNSIGLNLNEVESIGNTRHGFKVNPTNSNFIACQAIGNGLGNANAYGLWATRNTNSASVNNSLALIGFRSEQNGAAGGYEVKIDAGIGYTMIDPSFYPTTGAHCLGIGTTATGADSYVQSMVIIGGYFGTSTNTYPTQKAIVLGSDARNTVILNARLNYQGSLTTPDALITKGLSLNTNAIFNSNLYQDASGTLAFPRVIQNGATQPPAIGGTPQVYFRTNAGGKIEMVVQFPTGAAQVVATQP